MTERRLNTVFSLLFCLLFFIIFCQTANANNQQNLTALQTKLNRLEYLNNQSRKDLTEVKFELKILTEESQALRNELSELKIISTKQEYSLKKANNLLEEYKKETERKIRIVKFQRTLAYVLVGMVTIALI